MSQGAGEAGTEFVLDNRKLIVGFVLLMFVCGAFFVIGFMEGKRQVLDARMTGGSGPNNVAADLPETASAETEPLEDESVREQLDWYKNVKGRGESAKPPARETPAARVTETASDKRAQPAPAAVPVKKPAESKATAAPPARTVYSVQIGAFTLRKDAENRMNDLKAKGYSSFIEPPGADNRLFLVKVGKFGSRAQAVAMQLRLKRDGFSSFIKTSH